MNVTGSAVHTTGLVLRMEGKQVGGGLRQLEQPASQVFSGVEAALSEAAAPLCS